MQEVITMLNVNMLRFEQRQDNKRVWDVVYGVSRDTLATITEMYGSGVAPTHSIVFRRHMGGFASGPVVVATREEAVRYIQKYFSGELERFVDDEP